MELVEILKALHQEMSAAGILTEGSSVNLAFSARKSRDGDVSLDFVDAAAMSKPRAEELHRLEIALTGSASGVFKVVEERAGAPGSTTTKSGDAAKTESRESPPPLHQVKGKPYEWPEKKS